MKKHIMVLLPVLMVSLVFATLAMAQDSDSLKVKNEIQTQNKGVEKQLRVRTEEGDLGQGEMIQTRTREEKKLGEGDSAQVKGDSAQVKEQNKVRTQNKGEDQKIRTRTEESDKGQGDMTQTSYRDEDGDGICDSTQTKEQTRTKTKTQQKDTKSEDMTPQGGANGQRGSENSESRGR